MRSTVTAEAAAADHVDMANKTSICSCYVLGRTPAPVSLPEGPRHTRWAHSHGPVEGFCIDAAARRGESSRFKPRRVTS